MQRALPLCLCLSMASGCDVDLGGRATLGGRTLGQIVYREACQRVIYTAELAERAAGGRRAIDAAGVSYRPLCEGRGAPPPGAPPVAWALQAERPAIIEQVDAVAPEPLLEPLDRYLRALAPLEDEGMVGAVVRGTADVLRSFASDPAATAALGRLGWRDGFRPAALVAGVPRALLADPELDALLGSILPLVASARPGLQEAPAAEGLRRLLRALAAEMRQTQPVADPASPERTLRIALRLLLSSHPDLRALPQPVLAVLRDHRGLPLLDSSGGLPAPYVDRNGDGLPDVDASGRFVGSDGMRLPAIAPFPVLDPAVRDLAAARDAQGRALRQAGDPRPLYRYIDLSATALGALVREGYDLLDPRHDVPLALLTGMGHLLGPRREAERRYPSGQTLRYSGFADQDSALLDLIHAYLQLLGYSDTGDGSGADLQRLLGVLRALLHHHEAAVARTLGALAQVLDEAKKPLYDEARLDERATLYDDLAPVLVRLLRVPGLVSDLVQALRDPAVADLGLLGAQLATDSSYIYMNQDQLDWTRPAATIGTTGKPVRRDLPDSDVNRDAGNPANNRSLLQRLLHLVHDANGLTFCNRRDAKVRILLFELTYSAPCSLFKIDDLALFYVLSFVGKDMQARPQDFHPTSVAAGDFYNALSDSFQRDLIRLLGGLGESVLEGLMGIPGFGRFPHPAVAARLLFQDPDRRSDFLKGTIDPGPCLPRREGTLCCNQDHAWRQHHDGVLFALERLHPRDPQGRERTSATFFTAFKPVVAAFARHAECVRTDATGRCLEARSAAKILVDLLTVLHRHWPTPRSRFFGLDYEPMNQKSGAVRYEPLLAQVLAGTDLWPAMLGLAQVLPGLRTADGQPAVPILSNALRWFMDPAAPRLGGPLAYRNGRTLALRGDGQPAFRRSNDPVLRDVLPAELAGRVTPYYLLADAYRTKRERLAQDPPLERRWKEAVSRVGDLLLPARPGGFQNPRVRPLLLLLIDLLSERIEAHARAGDLDRWVRQGLLEELRDSLTGPVLAGAVDLAAQISTDPAGRRALQRLLHRLLDPAGTGAPAVLALTADLLQLLLDEVDLVPLVRAASAALDPDQGPVQAALALMRRARHVDPDQVLLRLLANLYGAGPGPYPLYVLAEAAAEINRQRAGEPGVRGSDLDAADYRAVLSATARLLADQDRGVTRLLDIVRMRKR
ncbi:MAG: hypothetical protein RMK29_01120 [Myxococcales bacterium]|nr:hypothetical protein [Myxococcales bacterium]